MNRLRSSKLGLLVLAQLALVAVFADLLASDVPLISQAGGHWYLFERLPPGITADFSLRAPLPGPGSFGTPSLPPSTQHLLGTDVYGRDVLACTIHGARHTLGVVGIVIVVMMLIGVPAGLAAGRGGRSADGLLARAVEVTGALPTLIVLAALQAKNLISWQWSLCVVAATLGAVRMARLVRGEVLRIGGQDFVLAAGALGAGPLAIIWRHLLPHVLGPAWVAAAFSAAGVVALEAGVSFVGFGGPSPSWGSLLGQVGGGLSLAASAGPLVFLLATTGALYAIALDLSARYVAGS